MRVRRRISCLLLCFSAWHGEAANAESLSQGLRITVNIADDGSPSSVSGDLTLVARGKSSCFYLPYNNKDFRSYDKLKDRFNISEAGGTPPAPRGGKTKVTTGSNFELIDPYLLRVSHKPGETIQLNFKSDLPRYAGDHPKQWYFYEFYPMLLARCYERGSDPLEYETRTADEFRIDLTTPTGWMLHAPDLALTKGGRETWAIKVPEFAFALTQGFSTGEFTVGGTQIHLAYLDQQFLKLVPTLREAYSKLSTYFGALPYQHLWFLDAAQFERDDLPGLLLLNRAKQEALQEFQSQWLNWAHWASVTLFSRQWFGGLIRRRTHEDEWLMRGTAEFGSLQVLQDFDTRFEFFNVQEGASSFIDLNFREIHDLGLTVLFQDDTKALLTTQQFSSATPFRLQHAMLPLRHAAALRHLQSLIGRERMREVLTQIVLELSHKHIGPKDFYAILARELVKAKGEVAAREQFAQWWTTNHWFDLALNNFEQAKVGDNWVCRAKVSQNANLSLWSVLTTTDDQGDKRQIPLQSLKTDYTLEFRSPRKIVHAVIDEERETFDVDRYNNSSDFPSIKFYPGSARGIPDDGYTVIWLPYPFRRAGQPWSVALQTGLFRYINNTAALAVETEMGAKHRTAFRFKQNIKYPIFLTSGQLLAEQDIYGSRKLEMSIGHGPLLPIEPSISAGIAARHRLIVGQKESDHGTYAVSFDIHPKGEQRYLTFRLLGEYEDAPEQSTVDFDYQRRYAILDIAFFFRHVVDYNLRVFRGELTGRGEIPNEILFRPENIAEARMRLDQSGVQQTTSLYSFGHDLLLPTILSFHDFGVLTTSRLKWRLFYDHGRDLDAGTMLSDAGVGFDAPLGGDLAGVGTLAVSKISFMSILYSRVDTEVSTRARFLFNIGSEF